MQLIEPEGSVKVFISYAHADQELHKNLEEHLSPLKHSGKLTVRSLEKRVGKNGLRPKNGEGIKPQFALIRQRASSCELEDARQSERRVLFMHVSSLNSANDTQRSY
jgi:hypothetical protein